MEAKLKFDYTFGNKLPWAVVAKWVDPKDGQAIVTTGYGKSATVAANEAITHLMLSIACTAAEELHED